MIEEIAKRLKDRRIDIVADKTGLSRGTVVAIRDGLNTNPKLDTILKLQKYFEEKK